MNDMKFAEFVSTGQLLMSRFHQLSGGKSGNGCGNAAPRAEFIAQAGTIELVRTVSNVSSAMTDGHLHDKKRNECLFIQTSRGEIESREIGASDMPLAKRHSVSLTLPIIPKRQGGRDNQQASKTTWRHFLQVAPSLDKRLTSELLGILSGSDQRFLADRKILAAGESKAPQCFLI